MTSGVCQKSRLQSARLQIFHDVGATNLRPLGEMDEMFLVLEHHWLCLRLRLNFSYFDPINAHLWVCLCFCFFYVIIDINAETKSNHGTHHAAQ